MLVTAGANGVVREGFRTDEAHDFGVAVNLLRRLVSRCCYTIGSTGGDNGIMTARSACGSMPCHRYNPDPAAVRWQESAGGDTAPCSVRN